MVGEERHARYVRNAVERIGGWGQTLLQYRGPHSIICVSSPTGCLPWHLGCGRRVWCTLEPGEWLDDCDPAASCCPCRICGRQSRAGKCESRAEAPIGRHECRLCRRRAERPSRDVEQQRARNRDRFRLRCCNGDHDGQDRDYCHERRRGRHVHRDGYSDQAECRH